MVFMAILFNFQSELQKSLISKKKIIFMVFSIIAILLFLLNNFQYFKKVSHK